MAFTPTDAMVAEAQRGLDWRAEHNRGGTAVGVARARDIVNKRALSLDTVKRMSSYFARHEVDKQGTGWSPGDDGYPSAGRIAWALWGGEPGRRWALAIITESAGNDRALQENDIMPEQRDLDLEVFTPRQNLQYQHDEHLVELFGQYDQGIGPDGAHYVAESPFAGEGLVCSNCAFYDGARACEIVSGDIDPNGICKRWVIPASLAAAEPAPAGNVDTAVRYSALELEHRRVNGREVEFRTVSVGQIEVRDADSGGMTFTGYAAVFDSPSEPLPFTETIRTGAFKRSLQSGREVRMFRNHNTDDVLGSTRAGTLRLVEDARGLKVEADLPDTTVGRDLAVLMRRGDVHSMSFGFSVPRGGDAWSDDGQARELRELILHEVSVVTGFPAYAATSAAVRSADEPETSNAAMVEPDPAGIPVVLARRFTDLYARKA